MLEEFGIDAAEQPLPVGDVLGMAKLQSATSIPVFLHEGAFDVADVVTLIELGGSNVIGINAERPGGLLPALELIDYASRRGIGTIIHNQPLGLGTALLAHLAAARFDRLGHAVEPGGRRDVQPNPCPRSAQGRERPHAGARRCRIRRNGRP